MIQFTDSFDVFAAAYVEAQKNVRRAAKDARNPHFKSTYADLASVDDACRDAFHEHDIAILQAPGHVVDGKMHMATVLIHKSGQRVAAELSVPLAKNDAQAYGSAVTYARRYALAAMTGVIAGEDDDGNAASAPPPRREAKQEPRQGVSEQLSDGYRTESAKMLHSEMLKPQTPEKLKEWRKANADMLKALDEHDGKIMFDSYQQRLGHLTAAVARA